MKDQSRECVSAVRKGQRGQSIVFVAALLPVLIAVAALVIDLGYAYASYQELVSATKASALAGGAAIPNPSAPTATAAALKFSALTNDLNYHANLQNVSLSINLTCVSPSTYPTLNLPPCADYPSCASGCNMIQVTQSATVSTFFARIFGIKSIPMSATAVASAKGGLVPPYHIVMVIDTTGSMGMGTDSGCTQNGTSVTPEQCAQYGVQTLLQQLDPCAVTQATCTASSTPGVSVDADDQVALMVFPGLCSSTAAGVTTANCPTLASGSTLTNTDANTTYAPKDYACPTVAPPIASYNNDPEYLLLGFQSNYRFSDNSGLNTSSNIFEAVGVGTNNCGVGTPGGKGTFYAGALQAAYDYLNLNNIPGIQNIIIILSDGDATATASDMSGNVAQIDGPWSAEIYPSTQECANAVSTANWIKSNGVLIYSISYGSETSGCTTDTSPTTTPCLTMQGMSSLPLTQYFFSIPDSATAGGTVCTGAVSITTMNQVFTTIAADLTVSRLVPNGDF